jgi:anaerobic ribonucleoside-triphosphate reductase
MTLYTKINYISMANAMTNVITEIDKQIQLIKDTMNDPDLCKDTASTWTRITGYYRAVEFFNIGKEQEQSERKNYVLSS